MWLQHLLNANWPIKGQQNKIIKLGSVTYWKEASIYNLKKYHQYNLMTNKGPNLGTVCIPGSTSKNKLVPLIWY